MAHELQVKVHPEWLKDETALMKRLHYMLTPDKHGPWRKRSGYNWQLDASNDWWAEIREGELVLATRYNDKALNAFAAFVSVFLG